MKMTAGRRALDKIYKRRDRFEIPEWQREEVWDEGRQKQLIDSVLRGWKLPKFYFLKVSDDEYEVVDGQQRLMAIYAFFDGELGLAPSTIEKFGGPYYKDLSTKVADAFDDFEIEFDEIEEAEERELKDFFQRLQQGLPLTASERLNSVHSKLRDYCRRVAAHNFFSRKVAFPNTRYAHFDVVSKAAAIELEGSDTSLRFDALRALFNQHAAFSSTSAVGKRLKEAVAFLDRAFPRQHAQLKNRTIVQSLITLTCRLIAGGHAAGKEKEVAQFFEVFMEELSRQVELGPAATDTDFLRFQRSVNANVRVGARVRQEVMLRKLFLLSPELADAFDATAVAESGVSGRIGDLAESIRELIAQANEIHAANHGEDLFKATSKTARAQARLGKAIRNATDYQRLIDDLYFLCRESVGSRLSSWPSAFADVNTLRTELRHDVDHGDAGKTRAKRRKAGKVFKKYSGATSPQAADPSRFPLAHANLLTGIEADLRSLITSLASEPVGS